MAAESLDDGEFWLPPQFLTDDDIFVEAKTKSPGDLKPSKGALAFDTRLFPFEFPYEFGSFGGVGVGGGISSDLSSPVESVLGSTETESSDEEDYLAGLTRQMAHSTLEGLDFRRNDLSLATESTKGRAVSGSPQSTLCGCRQGSSHGSPNGISNVSSPPATWDLLYAAAGEVAKMRMDEELYGAFNTNNTRSVVAPPRKPSPVTLPMKNPDVGFYQQPSLSYQKLQASQFQHLRQQQMMKQQQQHQHQQQSSGVWGGQHGQGQAVVHANRGRNNIRPLGLSASAWPPLQPAQQQQQQQQPQQQQQGGSGMRALFLGNPGAKRECAGTGVFLPRRIGAPAESRKKPGCSTVLLPARVVQALNLNLDDIGGQPQFQPRYNGAFAADSATSRARNSNFSNQKRNPKTQQAMSSEVRLPQEWTY